MHMFTKYSSVLMSSLVFKEHVLFINVPLVRFTAPPYCSEASTDIQLMDVITCVYINS